MLCKRCVLRGRSQKCSARGVLRFRKSRAPTLWIFPGAGVPYKLEAPKSKDIKKLLMDDFAAN